MDTGACRLHVERRSGGWLDCARDDGVDQQQGILLEHKQAQCQATLKEDIASIVKSAIDQHALSSSIHLQDIHTKLMVLVALHGETQKDVQSIFERLDRRHMERSTPTPHGERRDQ